MSYALPDEPRNVLRAKLAVDGFWPLLALMLLGPAPGLVWMAFNSWALGCRRALSHSVIALAALLVFMTLAVVFFSKYRMWLEPVAGENARLIANFCLIALQGALLALAYGIVLAQRDARDWQITYGEPPRSGLYVLIGIFAIDSFLLAPYTLRHVLGLGWFALV